MSKKSLRIAIADDEVDMRDYLQKVLTRWGHQVVGIAENGTQLAAECLRTRPDLVITDLKMPNGDGVSAIEQIWKDESVPVIIISAFAQDIPEWLMARPMLAAVLIKPIKTIDLEPVVTRIATS
jgi:two-component system chemotaxis response regulator CheY